MLGMARRPDWRDAGAVACGLGCFLAGGRQLIHWRTRRAVARVVWSRKFSALRLSMAAVAAAAGTHTSNGASPVPFAYFSLFRPYHIALRYYSREVECERGRFVPGGAQGRHGAHERAQSAVRGASHASPSRHSPLPTAATPSAARAVTRRPRPGKSLFSPPRKQTNKRNAHTQHTASVHRSNRGADIPIPQTPYAFTANRMNVLNATELVQAVAHALLLNGYAGGSGGGNATVAAAGSGYGATVALFAMQFYEKVYSALPSYESALVFVMRNPRLVTYAVSAGATLGVLFAVLTAVSYFFRCIDRLRYTLSFLVCFPLWYWPLKLLCRGLAAAIAACLCGCCGCCRSCRRQDSRGRRRRREQAQQDIERRHAQYAGASSARDGRVRGQNMSCRSATKMVDRQAVEGNEYINGAGYAVKYACTDGYSSYGEISPNESDDSDRDSSYGDGGASNAEDSGAHVKVAVRGALARRL